MYICELRGFAYVSRNPRTRLTSPKGELRLRCKVDGTIWTIRPVVPIHQGAPITLAKRRPGSAIFPIRPRKHASSAGRSEPKVLSVDGAGNCLVRERSSLSAGVEISCGLSNVVLRSMDYKNIPVKCFFCVLIILLATRSLAANCAIRDAYF